MLVDKQKKNQDVIVCGEDNVIRHIPAKNFMIICKDTTKAPKGQQTTGSGEKPLQTVAYTLALKGRQDVLLPLWGFGGTIADNHKNLLTTINYSEKVLIFM
ncbi:MAG: hypothetical protein IJP74_01870 [Prevotella sp.]|nr:hypothetical protein [Prevotella sp.]